VDVDLAPLIAQQRGAIGRQRDDLDRLDTELTGLELTFEAAGRVRGTAGRRGWVGQSFSSGRQDLRKRIGIGESPSAA